MPGGAPPSPDTPPSLLSLNLIYPSSSALPLPLLSLPLSLIFSPHVVLLSLSSSSLIPRSHMVSLSGSVCVWCYPEFTGAPRSYMCVCVFYRRRVCVCLQAYGFACLGLCVCVLGRVQQGSSRLCNSLKCGPFRGRLHPSSSSVSVTFLPSFLPSTLHSSSSLLCCIFFNVYLPDSVQYKKSPKLSNTVDS